MVNFGVATHGGRPLYRQTGLGREEAAVFVEVCAADDVALARYEAFCRNAIYAPPQHPVWVRSWIMATGADAIVVSLSREGRPLLQLVLEVVAKGPSRIARFPGGKHANGSFVAAARGAPPLAAAEGRALAAAIRSARPDIDLVRLDRQNPDHDGAPNPLFGLATVRSPNVSLAVDLRGGFAEVLARAGAKRKRKKYKAQLRKFEDQGGYRLIEAQTPAEVDRLIGEFYVMKAARLRERGIPDVFGPPEIQAFFRTLFTEAVERQPAPFVLHAVEVAGEIRAVNGLSVTDHSFVCEFGGIRDETGASPGYFLDYNNIEQACETDRKLYDFSVGDEVYKRSWCDVETWQFDTLLPLTTKGRLMFVYELARTRAVGFVKSSPAVWSLLKRARTAIAGKAPADEG